jgi:O-Antigen ligase
MSILFLLPAFISLYFVIRRRIEAAFLSVYLPCLLLLPNGYALRLPHIPPISAAQGALVPLGIVALGRLVRKGLPSIMDVLVFLFIASMTASEVLREQVMTDGIFSAATSFVEVFLAYAVGRMMIEPNLRFATVKRFVVLILLLGPFGLYEWRIMQNLFGVIGQRVFALANVTSDVQIRSGHGRMAVSFGDSELAGIVVAMTAALNAWLVHLVRWRSRVNFGTLFTKLEKFRIPVLLLLLYAFLTQSRGPQGGLVVALIIVQIPRFKNKKLAGAIIGILLAVAAVGAYGYLERYTNVTDPGAQLSEQQGSAMYRREMNELYKPLVAEGGLLGWGVLSHPVLPGKFSIDNEFLFVHLCYGDAGYVLLILIAGESIRRLISFSWKLKAQEDQALAISLLAALVALWISLLTVYMGDQLPQIAFLLIGWSQAIVPGSNQLVLKEESVGVTKFEFKRVFK